MFACSSPGTQVTALLAAIVVPSGLPTLPPLLIAIASEAATAVAPAAARRAADLDLRATVMVCNHEV
jgi:hypothetical protein